MISAYGLDGLLKQNTGSMLKPVNKNPIFSFYSQTKKLQFV